MKCNKSILAFVLAIALIFSMTAVPAFAEKTQGSLVGDCLIYLPDSDSVKLTYNLVDTNGADVTENVTYNVTSSEADWKKWLDVDTVTGDVYVSHDAVGKSFVVSAESDTYKASQEITIANVRLCADFDDGVIPAWIDNEKGQEIFTNNGNQYLYVKGFDSWNTIYPTVKLKDKNLELKTSHLSIDMKFMISHMKSASGNNAPKAPMTIHWENQNGMSMKKTGENKTWDLAVRATDYNEETETRKIMLPGQPYNPSSLGTIALNSTSTELGDAFTVKSSWYDATEKTFNDGFEFAKLEFDVADSKIYAKINDGTMSRFQNTWGSDPYVGLLDFNNASVTSISLSGAIDDLEIYTGEKVSHSYYSGLKIDGDENILRAPVGTSAKVVYNLAIEDASIAGSTIPENVSWSVSSHTGVSVADATKGEVTVAGDAASGTFKVLATGDDGTLLATKDVTIIDKLTSWTCANKDRIFSDMEGENEYKVGDYPGKDKGTKNYSAFEVSNSGAGSVVKSETRDGKTNKYISSQGYLAYSSTSGSGAKMRPYDWQYNYGKENNVVTFEGKFMIENEILNGSNKNPGAHWSLVCAVDNASDYAARASLDLRYDDLGEGVAGIYIYENGTGHNGEFITDESGNTSWKLCNGSLIALVEIDSWFDLRIEADYENKVYNIWIDDVLVVKNIATGDSEHFKTTGSLYSGAAFDDIALYTGSKVAVTQSVSEQLTVFKDFSAQEGGSMGFNWTEATPDGQNSSASAALMSGEDYSGATLIAAIYGADNSLINVSLAPVTKTSAGNSLAFANATGKVPADGFAKIFLWNMENLVPVK